MERRSKSKRKFHDGLRTTPSDNAHNFDKFPFKGPSELNLTSYLNYIVNYGSLGAFYLNWQWSYYVDNRSIMYIFVGAAFVEPLYNVCSYAIIKGPHITARYKVDSNVVCSRNEKKPCSLQNSM